MTHTIYYTVSEFGVSLRDTTFHHSKELAREAGRSRGLTHVLDFNIESDEPVKRIGFSLGSGAPWNGESFIALSRIIANPTERAALGDFRRKVQE